nr:reverse transcriptase domain-containing protein [Tanacetum cinerariifolium]
MTYNMCNRPTGLGFGLHKVIHGLKPNKTIRRHNGPKSSSGQTGYVPEAARRTKGFQRTLSQDSGSPLSKPKSEKERNDKLKEVKARLNFEERSGTSRHSESRTMSTREYERRHSSRRSHSHNRHSYSRYTETLLENEDSGGGLWKSSSKKKKSSKEEDDLSQPWVCEEIDHFTPRIRYFDFIKTRMHSLIKTYEGSEDPKDHIKIFQAAAKTERWVMPTWCHMFNSTLTRNARRKCIKDPIELHNIKQRNGKSTEDFVRRYKLESRDVKGAPECMRISGFMHGITNPELIKRLYDKIPKTVDEMMRVTTGLVPLECALVSGPGETLLATKPNLEERVKVVIKPEYPKQAVMIGSTLTEGGRDKLCGLLQHAYKGLHQIQMAKEDEEKTAFITNQGIFCYTKMPFGLRNGGATYQRLVGKAFHKQIGRNLEVYVDDLVIKSRMEDEIVRVIEETFKTLREINMKLNPKKCTFGVEEGMFLRYKVSTKGLKVCPDKVEVVLSLPSLKCLKDVQK